VSAPVSWPLDVPVLFLIFNRPRWTRQVFDAIRGMRPASLFVAGDGPRLNVDDDAINCEEARRIATTVDWSCNLRTRFQRSNLGPGPGVSSALRWFFDHVSAGIILEDDCRPGRSFFRFCSELLEYYRDEPSVMHISGHNYQYGRRRGHASYYFSSYTHVGGWATWKRAWSMYDVSLIPPTEQGEIWDAAWMLSVQRNRAVAVVPNVNLVSNIGFGQDATHTRELGRWSNLPALEMEFPLVHPRRMRVDQAADSLTYYANFRNIPDLRLTGLYRVADFIKLVPLRTRKLARRLTGWIVGARPGRNKG
jgi:hypothetical protein